jgi:dTDP-glucose 4,6-dehydratase
MPIETLQVSSLGTLHVLGLTHEKGAHQLLASTWDM